MSAPGSVLRLEGARGLRSPAERIEDLPGPPPGWLLGNLPEVRRLQLHAALEHWAERYGPFFQFRLANRRLVGIADAVLIGEILRHRPESFGRGGQVNQATGATAVGVFTAEGEQWRRQRKLVMRALTPEQIRRSFPIIESVTQRLEQKWRAAAELGEPFDAARDLKCYAVDVATWLSLGEDIDTLRHPENPLQSDIEQWFALIGRRTVAPFPYWKWIRLPVDRRAEEASARISALVERLIAAARKRFDEDPGRRQRPANILESLLAVRDEPGSEFSDDDVTGNVVTMLFAGEDTAANAMAWMLIHLSMHGDAAARARAEADRVLGDSPIVASFGDLEQLAYLEAFAYESMRHKPIAPMLAARALVDVDLAGLRVPRGQVLMMPQRYASQRSGAFDPPQAFSPERWLGDAHDGADDPKRKMVPFGGGPRFCPGRYLAMVEMKMVVSMALRNFTVSADGDPAAVRERLALTMGPQGWRMKLAPRTRG